MNIDEILDKFFILRGGTPDEDLKARTQHEPREELKQVLNTLIEERLKSGFYAGQAMAGVELEDCHNNWKKWNTHEN